MQNIIIRPKGGLYITYFLVLKLAILIGLLLFSIAYIISETYWALVLNILPLVLLILQIREICRYKLIIKEGSIWIAANRDIFLVRHKDLTIKYKNLKSIQFYLGIEAIVVSLIAFRYKDEKKIKYLNTLRFSRKQVEKIMQLIKENADKHNGYEVEILNSEIQGEKQNKEKSN